MKHVVMKKSDGKNVDHIDIFGTIGEDWWGDSTTQREVLDAIRASKAPKLQININSGGGSIYEGMGMYDAIKSTDAKTTARVVGFSGSMATIVMLAADSVEIVDGSLVMIHNPSTIVGGESKDLRKHADTLDKLRAGMVRIYAAKMGLDDEDVEAMMDDETWWDAKEARSIGIVDKIVGEDEDDAKAALTTLDLTATAPAAKIPMRFAAAVGGAVSPGASRGTMQTIDPEGNSPVATISDVKDALGLEAEATDEEVLEAVQALVDSDEDEDGDDPDPDPDDEDDEDEEGDEEDDDADAVDDDPAPTAEIPEGMVLVDADQLEALKAAATASGDVDAKGQRLVREEIVAKAIKEGRIPAAKSTKYLNALEKDFDTYSKLLTAKESEGGLAKGLVPLAEIGTSHDDDSAETGGAPVAYDASLFPQLSAAPASTIETE